MQTATSLIRTIHLRPERLNAMQQKMRRGFPNEREAAIIACAAEGVTPEEVRHVLLACKQVGYSYQDCGKIRAHYDSLVDDCEKRLRIHLGIEYDYTIEIVEPRFQQNRFGALSIDGLAYSTWCLLNRPYAVVITKHTVLQAIRSCENRKQLEEAERLRFLYADVIAPPAYSFSPFAQRLLATDNYLLSRAEIPHIQRVINKLTEDGHTQEAGILVEKYSWLLYDAPASLKYTQEESRRVYEKIMEKYNF